MGERTEYGATYALNARTVVKAMLRVRDLAQFVEKARQVSLSRKITIILAVPLLFELVFLAALIEADRRSARYRLWQSRSTEAILATTQVLDLMTNAEGGTRGYVATGYPGLLEAYDNALGALPAKLHLLETVTRAEYDVVTSTLPDQHQVKDLERSASAVLADLREDNVLVRAGRRTEALARLKADKMAMDRFRAELTAFHDEEVAVQREQQAQLRRAEMTARIVIITLLAGNLVIMPIIVWLLTRNVGRRLHHIIENMARLGAGEMRLPALTRQDEIGRLDRGFHEMADRLRAADEQIRCEKEELERLNAEKNRFLGMAAHDLRNPLFGVLSLTEALTRRGSVPEADQKLLEQIAKATRSMKTIVDDFLDVSAIESGELRLRLEPVELGSAVEEWVAMQRDLAVRKNIEVHFERNGGVTVPADRDKIGQVMTNLLTNALKFSPMHSTVDVTVVASSSAVRLAVADSGPGVSAADRDLLFRPFSVASARATGGESSTGLGLAICQKIVEGHGGRIWVESNQGRGSVFTFELPLAL